jgi:hypothetical protein
MLVSAKSHYQDPLNQFIVAQASRFAPLVFHSSVVQTSTSGRHHTLWLRSDRAHRPQLPQQLRSVRPGRLVQPSVFRSAWSRTDVRRVGEVDVTPAVADGDFACSGCRC